MSSMIVKPPDDEHAYEQIEAAVMETSRGRWFLAEYAKRNRHAETGIVLDAIAKLQKSIGHQGAARSHGRLEADILDMARAIAQTEREIRAIQADGLPAAQFFSASDELDAVVTTTERATSTILSAAERVQEFAWTMRERSGAAADCDMLDACATEIYTACGFQDLTAQRIRKVVTTLHFIDQRIKAMLAAAGLEQEIDAAAPQAGTVEAARVSPSLRSSDIWMSDANQAEIDDTFDFFVPAATAEPTMVGAHLLDLDAEAMSPAQALPAPAAKAKEAIIAPGTPLQIHEITATDLAEVRATQAGSVAVPPAMPYDALPTADKLRAFR